MNKIKQYINAIRESDQVLKLRCLPSYIFYRGGLIKGFLLWRRKIWIQNLNEPICCNGSIQSQCGCMGITLRAELEEEMFKKK